MKLERSRQVLREIGPVVTPGVNVKFVGNAARRKQIVKRPGARMEAEIIFGAAIKVDLQSCEVSGTRQRKRVVAFPEDAIGR